tara:strand:- start:86 stop:295 length:210 start_codon:yes stop_codon:yes gene_type:complete
MVLQNDHYLIHYWTKGEEHLDSDHATLEEAGKRFKYLKDNWQEVFPDGFTAVELVDQYFDQIDQFNPFD